MAQESALDVRVLTPVSSVLKKPAASVVAPSVSGELTLLIDHAPLLAELQPGVVRVDGAPSYFITGGFLEVQQNNVLILAEGVEPVTELVAAEAEAQLREAEAALGPLAYQDAAYLAAQKRRDVAQKRLEVARASTP